MSQWRKATDSNKVQSNKTETGNVELEYSEHQLVQECRDDDCYLPTKRMSIALLAFEFCWALRFWKEKMAMNFNHKADEI